MKNKALICLVVFFHLLICSSMVYGQEVPSAGTPESTSSTIDLDLSSTQRDIAASTVLGATQQAAINLAGVTRTVTAADMLTASEMVALNQVLNAGKQYLQLNDIGAAIGGGFRLTPTLSSSINSLVIPEGVRAYQNAAIVQNLNLTGNFINSGSYLIRSSDAGISATSLSAASIYNNAGALISSTLANLTLNAINNIVNAGAINSAGNLNLYAGGSIVNALPSGVAGIAPIMQAMNNLNMQASSIINSGQMIAQMGNLNAAQAMLTNAGVMQALNGSVAIQNLVGNTLVVNNTSGLISAMRDLSFITQGTTFGDIGQILSKSSITVNGGTLTGATVNFVTPDGHVNVQADQINGGVNLTGGTAAVGSLQGDLKISSMNLSGDPIYYAAGGDLDLTGLLSNTGGEDFVALAGGNIIVTADPGTILDAEGGNITIAAGVDFNITGGPSPISCSDCSGLFSINGASLTGGNVDMGNVSFVTSGNGSVTIEAHEGTDSAGTIYMNAAVAGTTVTITGDADVALGSGASSAGGNFSASAGNVLTINGPITAANILLQGSPVMLNGNSISAGSGSVTLRPSTSMAVNVGVAVASGITFDITVDDLAGITAGTLIIGDSVNTSSIQLASALDVSAGGGIPGSYNLEFYSAGDFMTAVNNIALGTRSLTIDAAGFIDLDTISGSGSTIDIRADADATGSGALTMWGSMDISDDGSASGIITLQGSPVLMNGQTINAGFFGEIHLNPSFSMDVYVGGDVESGFTFDITAGDLANITAGAVTIGDNTNTNSLNLAGNVDVSASYNLTLLSAGNYTSDGYLITLGSKNLDIFCWGNGSINGISGAGSRVVITAMGSLTLNDAIVVSNGAFANGIDGEIHLQGSPIIFSLDFGEQINAGTATGVVTLNPSTDMDLYLGAPSGMFGTFDLSSSDLSHIRTSILNIGDTINTTSIHLADNIDLGSPIIDARQFNLLTAGNYNYEGFIFDSGFRSVSIRALGNIDTGLMIAGDGFCSLSMQAGGYVSLHGNIDLYNNVTLLGAPVMFNGNSIITAGSGTVTLRPTDFMDVNVGGAIESGGTFDITAGDLGNIIADTVIIGDQVFANSLSIVNDLNLSGQSGELGHFNLSLISNGSFSSSGTTITLGEMFNTRTLTVTTYSSADIGTIASIADGSANVYITAAGALTLNGNIDASGGGTTSGRIELRGSPVALDGNTLNAGEFGFVALAPTSDTNVAIADATGTAAPFDISAADLANITTGTLQIGDIFHTLTLTVEGDMDISGIGPGAYDLVLISAGGVNRIGRTITIGSNNIAISTNGGQNNLATGNLDISYLFEGNANWRPSTSSNFNLRVGGSIFSGVGGLIDLSAAIGGDGQITVVAGGAFTYNTGEAIITFTGSGASLTGGNIELNNVNFLTSNGNVTIEALGDPFSFVGNSAVGSVNAIGATGSIIITADNSINVGGMSISRATGDFTLRAAGSIQTSGVIYADNITVETIANDGSIFINDSLYASNLINISANGTGNVNINPSSSESSFIEAPTITINTNDRTVSIGLGVQMVTPVNLTSPGLITITAETVTNDGLIASLGANGHITIQANNTSVTLNTSANGRVAVDPLSGLITLTSANEVLVVQDRITGTISGISAAQFQVISNSGLLTLGDITSGGNITIETGTEIAIAAGSTLQSNSAISFTTLGNGSMLISDTGVNIIGNDDISFNGITYLLNNGTVNAVNSITIQSADSDVILVGTGILQAPTIDFQSGVGAVIATQDDMQGTVNVSSKTNLFLSVLNPSVAFVPGTMNSDLFDAASTPAGVANMFVSANQIYTDGNGLVVLSSGSFTTPTIAGGLLSITGITGDMVIAVRNDTDISNIDVILTDGGNLYVDTTNVGGLNFTGDIDTRPAGGGDGGYVVLNSTSTISIQNIFSGGISGGSGGAVRISSPGDITLTGFIDTSGNDSGDGGNVTINSFVGNVSVVSINTIGGSGALFSPGNGDGGYIYISAGGTINAESFLDSSAEAFQIDPANYNSLGQAGWIHLQGADINCNTSLRANGGGIEGNGNFISLLSSGNITVGGFIDSSALGGVPLQFGSDGSGGDVTIRAAGNINIVTVNSVGSANAGELNNNGGYIVIQSETGSVTGTGFLDSSAAIFSAVDGGGNAGMIFVVAPVAINGYMSYRAEGRSSPDIGEGTNKEGNGNNIRVETNGTAQLGFVSSSAQSIAAIQGSHNNMYAGRIDVIAQDSVDASTFRSNGGLSSGNGGDVNITSSNGDITTSFIFTTALAVNDNPFSAFQSNGGNINISAAGSINILSFIDTGGAAGGIGNAGSVTIAAQGGISSNSYISAVGGADGGNGGNITLTTTGAGSQVDIAFSLDSQARLDGNGGMINVRADAGIHATILASLGGVDSGHGGNITAIITGAVSPTEDRSIQVGDLDSRARHGSPIGSSNAGNIFVSTPDGHILVSGYIDSSSAGVSGNAGNVTLEFNSSTGDFTVGSVPANDNGVTGTISARADGSGNGGAVTIVNGSGDLNIDLNSTINVLSASGNDGSINFNYAQPGVAIAPNATSTVTVTGNVLGELLGTIFASGISVSISASAVNAALNLGTITATNGSVSVLTTASATGGLLTVVAGGQITADEGNITLQVDDTTNGAIVIGANSLVDASSSADGSGNVYITIGAVPGSPAENTNPNIDQNEINGGQIYLGSNNIDALAGPPQNTATADGANIIFNATISASQIMVGPGAEINAHSVAGGPILLDNLDLLDETVINNIQSNYDNGFITGTLIIVGGVIQAGTNLTIDSSILVTSPIKGLYIPEGVTLNMDGFITGSPLDINLDGASTASQVFVGGTQMFNGNSIINITSNQPGPVLIIAEGGFLGSTGSLNITTDGAISVSGTLTASVGLTIDCCAAGFTVTSTGIVASTGNISIMTSIFSNAGEVVTSGLLSQILIQDCGAGLTIGGGGIVHSTVGTDTSIMVQATAGTSIDFVSSQTFAVQTALGAVEFSTSPGGSITVRDGAIINTESNSGLTINTDTLMTEAGGEVNSTGSMAAIVQIINNSGTISAGGDMSIMTGVFANAGLVTSSGLAAEILIEDRGAAITVGGGGSVTTTGGGATSIIVQTPFATSITFTSSQIFDAGSSSGTVRLQTDPDSPSPGGLIFVNSTDLINITAASLFVTTGFFSNNTTTGGLSSTGDITTTAVTINNNGILSTSAGDINITVTSFANGGNLSTLDGTVNITANSNISSDLEISGTGVISGTSAGVVISTTSPTGTIYFMANSNQTLNGGQGPQINGNFVVFGSNATIMTNNNTCALCAGVEFAALPGGNLQITLPSSGTAYVSATNGGLLFHSADGSVTINSSAGTNATLRGLDSTGVWIEADTQDININANVTLNSDSWMTFNAGNAGVNLSAGSTIAASNGALSITTSTLNNLGSIVGDGAQPVSINAATVFNDGVITSQATGSSINITALSGNLSVTGSGTIEGAEILFVSGPGSVLVTQDFINGIVSGSSIDDFTMTTNGLTTLTVNNITTTEGSLVLTVNNGGSLYVAGNSTIMAGQNVTMTGNSITIGSGIGTIVEITAGRNVTITGDLVTIGGGGVGATVDIIAGTYNMAVNPFSTNMNDYTYSEGITNSGSVTITSLSTDIVLAENVTVDSFGASIGLLSANNIIIGANNDLFAQGGNVWMQAANEISISVGTDITSVARSIPGTVVIDGISIGNFNGGGVAIFAGTSLPDYNTYLKNTAINGRVVGGTYNSIGLVDTTGTPFVLGSNLINGAWVQLEVQGGGSLSLTNSDVDVNGGVLSIDPPGNININGVFLTIVGPSITSLPPPPAPSVNNQQVSAPAVVSIAPGNLPGNGPVNLPPDGTAIQTDVSDMATPQERDASQIMSRTAQIQTVTTQSAAWVFVSGNCQPFLAQTDDSLLFGCGGTMFAANEKTGGVTMREGRLVTITARKPLVVETAIGNVNIPADSASIVEQKPNGVFRLVSLTGSDAEMSVKSGNEVINVTVQPGEELVIADNSVSEEDLIPVDGIDRIPVGGSVEIAGLRVNKSRYNKQQMYERESLIHCSSGSELMASYRGRVAKLKKEMIGSGSVPSVSACPDKTAISTAIAGKDNRSNKQVKPTYQRISYAKAESPQIRTSNVSSIVTEFAGFKYVGGAELEINQPGVVSLGNGELLVSATKATVVKCGEHLVSVDPGAVVLISNNGDIVKVSNLWEKSNNGVRICTANKMIGVMVGKQLLLGPTSKHVTLTLVDDPVARRRSLYFDLPGGKAASRSEVSLVSLLGNTPVLNHLIKSDDVGDRQLKNKLMKMAACLAQTTANRGPYTTTGKAGR